MTMEVKVPCEKCLIDKHRECTNPSTDFSLMPHQEISPGPGESMISCCDDKESWTRYEPI